MLGQTTPRADERPVQVAIGPVTLQGALGVPDRTAGVVLFAHGSGSGRLSPRNRYVARQLREARLATLLVDLLTADEEALDVHTAEFRFDVHLLARRLAGATDWLGQEAETAGLPIGYFGASTGAAAALLAAGTGEARGDSSHTRIAAVVSRGGRPDLVGPVLPAVQAPTLLIVGGNDEVVLDLNRAALEQLGSIEKKLTVVPGAGHLFEEPGALEEVARLATAWFLRHLRPGG